MKTEFLLSMDTDTNKEEQDRITELVLQHAAAEKIFLLGKTTGQTTTESIFSQSPLSSQHSAHYYLLVLVDKTDEYTLNCIQDKIENNLQHFIPVTAIVLDTSQFNNWMTSGHPFTLQVAEKASVLYSKESTEFILPGKPPVESQANGMELLARQSTIRINEFLAGAELFRLRIQYKMAAFMLHQSAEQALRTLMIIHTGLRINTHSLDKLTRYGSMFSSQLPEVFQVRKENDKKLLSLLQKAYIDSRYKEDYTIGYEELMALTAKVKTIQALFLEEGQGAIT